MKNLIVYFVLMLTFHGSGQCDSSVLESRLHEARKFYPELDNVPIEIKFGKGSAPLTTRPVFGKKKWFRITISNTVNPFFTTIRFENLSHAAQIGVLCHELGHISQFIDFDAYDWFRYGAQYLVPSMIDSQENKTDRNAISHGAGFFLYSWSLEVRKNLGFDNWNGTRLGNSFRHERYLNPISIIAIIYTQTDFKYPVIVF